MGSFKAAPGVTQDPPAVFGFHGFVAYAVENVRQSGHAMRLETRMHLRDGFSHELQVGETERLRENVSHLAVSVTFGYRFWSFTGPP